MPDQTTPKDDADQIMDYIRRWEHALERFSRTVTAEIEAVRNRYADRIRQAEASKTALEKALEKLVMRYEHEIMEGSDRVDLDNGSILVKKERRVKRIKGMLARLKKAGLKSAIKIPKEYVNWDVVEKFNDATLKRLGTQRKKKTIVSYELKRRS